MAGSAPSEPPQKQQLQQQQQQPVQQQQQQQQQDEVKSQFCTREGVYRLVPHGRGGGGGGGGGGGRGVRLSASGDRLAFNCGKELYVYADDRPVDKKTYKGTDPTAHDFNDLNLLVGFSTGQVQILDPDDKDKAKLYNEERLIDKSAVTCVRWVPGSRNLFAVAHASGQLYVYDEELGCGAMAPHYQPCKRGDDYAVHACKAGKTRNPLYRWLLGPEGCQINEFAFSPCGAHVAVASQDGFLRVFHYRTMEPAGRARSYFGGFLCVCWSPDGNYVAVGGEDDLVTVWSFRERRVVARGQGHRSWVSVVAFDPYAPDDDGVCYRLGSVSQDTQLCLWDVTEDALRPQKTRLSAHAPCTNGRPTRASEPEADDATAPPAPPELNGSGGTLSAVTQRLAGFAFGDRRDHHRRNLGPASKPADAKNGTASDPAKAGGGNGSVASCDSPKLIGTAACPRFEDCPVLEPLVCKKIAHERLTALLFREDCLLTACQDGGVYTWARPSADAPPDPSRLFERDRRFERVDPPE